MGTPGDRMSADVSALVSHSSPVAPQIGLVDSRRGSRGMAGPVRRRDRRPHDVALLGRRERPDDRGRRPSCPARRPDEPDTRCGSIPVDRPRTAKNRVHLDVDCGSVDELVALGATVTAPAEQTGLGWTRMADPEGNDFCAFVRPTDRLPAYRLHGIGIDCHDAEAQARWWGELFGAQPGPREDDCWTLTGIAVDERMTLDFAPVPEPRSEPNGALGRPRRRRRLLACGAGRLWDSTGGPCSPTRRATSSASSHPPDVAVRSAPLATEPVALGAPAPPRRSCTLRAGLLDLGLVVRLARLVVDLLGDAEGRLLLSHTHARTAPSRGNTIRRNP